MDFYHFLQDTSRQPLYCVFNCRIVKTRAWLCHRPTVIQESHLLFVYKCNILHFGWIILNSPQVHSLGYLSCANNCFGSWIKLKKVIFCWPKSQMKTMKNTKQNWKQTQTLNHLLLLFAGLEMVPNPSFRATKASLFQYVQYFFLHFSLGQNYSPNTSHIHNSASAKTTFVGIYNTIYPKAGEPYLFKKNGH